MRIILYFDLQEKQIYKWKYLIELDCARKIQVKRARILCIGAQTDILVLLFDGKPLMFHNNRDRWIQL